MKNDPEFNIEFVQLVEKYPVLYNYTLTGHSNKSEVEKAWADIGLLLNETGTACQEKWRILRGGYNRYIKKKDESGPALVHKKPYYLAKYMDFLLPFLKSRSYSGNMKSPNDSNCETETTDCDAEREISYDHCEVVYEGADDNTEIINNTDRSEQFNMKKLWETYQQKEKWWESYYHKNFNNEEPEMKKNRLQMQDNPDLMFLKSLLPDMTQLDEKSKMKFKIEVLNSLNRLLYSETATFLTNSENA